MITDEPSYRHFRTTIAERIEKLTAESMLSEELRPDIELRIYPHLSTGNRRIWYRVVVRDVRFSAGIVTKHNAYSVRGAARQALALARKYGIGAAPR